MQQTVDFLLDSCCSPWGRLLVLFEIGGKYIRNDAIGQPFPLSSAPFLPSWARVLEQLTEVETQRKQYEQEWTLHGQEPRKVSAGA